MEGRLLRIGWIIMLLLVAYGVFLGLACISDPVGVMEPDFESTTGQSWAGFIAANPAATVNYVQMEMVFQGIALLAIAVLFLLVTLFAYRRGQRWSWYTLLAGGIIYWVGLLIQHTFIAADPIWPIIGLVLLVIALVLPAKSILTQKSS